MFLIDHVCLFCRKSLLLHGETIPGLISSTFIFVLAGHKRKNKCRSRTRKRRRRTDTGEVVRSQKFKETPNWSENVKNVQMFPCRCRVRILLQQKYIFASNLSPSGRRTAIGEKKKDWLVT